MKILIAEDDALSRTVLATHLTRLDHEVLVTEDGAEAWRRYQAEHPQLVITDWMMPKLDGLELCRMIRAAHRTRYTYVVLLTALGGKGSYLEGMEAGADDFITKPFDTETLGARLEVAARILALQATVRQLEGLLPICAYCKRIRDAGNVWQPVDRYIAQHTDACFSHGICPECFDHELKSAVLR